MISKGIGYKKNKEERISYKQVRERIERLVEMNLVERWTVKHPTQFKITYYRLTKSERNVLLRDDLVEEKIPLRPIKK